ncbi:CRTAC1 family protein [Mongoliimonas terrestris]|uniref:CRTAC1 family protein n=1 Tax=Mongoliimonas terrestris TaxID=1709001 RepID=UPI000949AB7F|nr:CRTAC1 family protein [Mongoliimonas terrestris]
MPRSPIALLAALALALPAHAADEAPRRPTGDIPLFTEEAAAAGVSQVYDGPWEFFVGGGVASFDCDGDRKPDMAIAGGRNPLKLYANRSKVGGPLRFEERPHGLDEKDAANVLGAYPLEIDGDGLTDLVLLKLGRNLLLKGLPGCRFEVANKAWGYDGGRAWTTAFAATFERGARFPTLAFGNYVDRAQPGSPWGTCADNDLFRPGAGDTPRYSERTPLTPGYCALSMLFTDWNRSGEPALRVTNDRQYYRGGEEQLWKVPPGGAVTAYGRKDGWQRLTIWGMGIAQFDLNVDGAPEYALSSMGDTKLQTLDEDADEESPVYRDIAFERGATAHRPYTGQDLRPSTGWHTAFADVNNDAAIDLFIAKGNVEAMPDFAQFDPSNLLLGRFDGSFAEAGAEAGIATGTKGRGAALVDFNLDGMLDLVQVNRGQPATVFRNLGAPRAPFGPQPAAETATGDTPAPLTVAAAPEPAAPGAPASETPASIPVAVAPQPSKTPGTGNPNTDLPRTGPMGNFLGIQLVQKDANRWAVGARIAVKTGTRTMPRDVLIGGGHASGHLGWTHVGLGTAERAEIRVQWPDGEWSHGYRVFANQYVVIERGKPDARYWYAVE